MLSMVIVPAASALPITYDVVVQGMSAHGYNINALHIPSVGLETGPRPGIPPNMYEDAAFVADHLTVLADAGSDILVISHSYGGSPASQSIKGLTKKERKEKGKTGGVVGLAYLTTLVPELGHPASTGPWSPLMEIDNGWFYYPDDVITARIVFSDIPLEEGLKYAPMLVNHSVASFLTPLTYEGYKHVPVSYLITEGDMSFPAEKQRSQIQMIERVSGNKVDVTTTPAGHVPPVTAPNDVINWLLSVAKKLENKCPK